MAHNSACIALHCSLVSTDTDACRPSGVSKHQAKKKDRVQGHRNRPQSSHSNNQNVEDDDDDDSKSLAPKQARATGNVSIPIDSSLTDF